MISRCDSTKLRATGTGGFLAPDKAFGKYLVSDKYPYLSKKEFFLQELLENNNKQFTRVSEEHFGAIIRGKNVIFILIINRLIKRLID